MKKNKQLIVITLLSAGTCISIAASKPSPRQVQSDFKNLQVLPKNISEDSLNKIMHGFNEALGVRCSFCHAGDAATHKMNFASDEKPEKDITRYMMRMTYAINSQFFNSDSSQRPDTISVVKCVTCHHGNPHPDDAVKMSGENNMNQGMPPGPPPPNQGMPMDSMHKPMMDSVHKQ